MLHREAVPPGTLDLLSRLCRHGAIEPFALVGGTSLALRFGHRISVDLDLFTAESFDGEEVLGSLREEFDVSESVINRGGMNLRIEGVEVDLVTYRYDLLEPLDTIDGIRMFSLPDTVAMKLAAVTNRGAKKDFFDVAEMLDRLGADEMMGCYRKKFPDQDDIVLVRSLSFFEDAEIEPDPKSLRDLSWEEVKAKVSAAVQTML